MLGLGHYNHFDARLPMALESLAEPGIDDCYEFDLHCDGDGPLQLDLRRTITSIVGDVRSEKTPASIAAKFHSTLAESLLAMAKAAKRSTGLDIVATSGGAFCNRVLANRLVARLNQEGFRVLLNRDIPTNDGGLALGQAAIAASRLRREM